MFSSRLLHSIYICYAFFQSSRLRDYADQSDERRPINVLAMLRVSSQKMRKFHERSVYCHSKDSHKLDFWRLFEFPAESNSEPLRGMNKKMTRVSKRRRRTNMWNLLQFSRLEMFEIVLEEKVRDPCSVIRLICGPRRTNFQVDADFFFKPLHFCSFDAGKLEKVFLFQTTCTR